MNLTYQKEVSESGVAIFELTGKILSVDDSKSMTQEIIACIDKKELLVIFDLKNLEYINSTGLNFIISSFTKLRNAGGELAIASVAKKVEDLLVITKLNTIFNSFDTLETALESFNKKTITNQ